MEDTVADPNAPGQPRLEIKRLPYNLNLLTVFAAVYETRSTTEAAERLSLSQPAISHALARLRRDIDDPLFVRRGQGLVPTPRAVELIALVRRLLQDAQRIFKVNTFEAATTNRVFRIAVSDYANLAVVRRIGEAFRRQAPAASLAVDLVSAQSIPQLLNGGLDAVVGCCLEAPSPLRTRALFCDSLVVAVAEGHPGLTGRNGGRSLSLEAYRRARHVQAGSLALCAGPADKALERLGLRRDVAFGTRDYRSALDMVAGSDLVLTLPSRVLALAGCRGVVAVPLPFAAPDLQCDAVWDSRCDSDEGLKWFTSLLVGAGSPQPDEVTGERSTRWPVGLRMPATSRLVVI